MKPPDLHFDVHALTIACIDVARSEAFYCELLGARRDPRDGHGCRWLTFGDLRINLLPNAEQPCPAQFPAHAMPILSLETADLAAAAAMFERAEVTVVEPCDGYFMMIADPDGLVIEVCQREA